jgi:dTDP-4-amino-4,6-dideoxygalactose transaminase
MKSDLAIHGGEPLVPAGLKKRWPEITAEDKAAVMAVLERGTLSGVHAPEVRGLEADWAAYTGAQHALSFNSGTAALHGALYAVGVGPGTEVITTAFSFSATFHAILQQNGVPVFVDIDPRTFNLDVGQIEAKISDRTRAIVPVHIHGLPCDMDEILALAEKYDLAVVEDACQAHGATYKGRLAGTMGELGVHSLNVTKNLSGADGGLLITDDGEYAEKVRMLRTLGERIGDEKAKIRPYTVYSIGWNYRTQELPAAFARSQLTRLDQYNAIGQRNGQFLSEKLSQIQGVVPPYIPPDRTTVYHKYRVRFDCDALGVDVAAAVFRDRLFEALEAEGVAVAIWHTEPMTSFPIFQTREGYGKGCPWSCPFYGKEISYNPTEYPQANRLLETSIVVNDEPHPIFVQDLELMEYYAAAFEKVLADPEKLVA